MSKSPLEKECQKFRKFIKVPGIYSQNYIPTAEGRQVLSDCLKATSMHTVYV